jgi:dGTPase
LQGQACNPAGLRPFIVHRRLVPAIAAGVPRAAYASDPDRSRGRRFAEPPSRLRTAFARDRDRLIHSTAFRRLRYKTQVFVAPDGDHFRVRLTHSLEVAQIARTLARALALDEDLTEVLALGHDIGHPPFGHSGDDALAAEMAPFGGFDHNSHALRIVTRLESRTPAFEGLNLSWEVLEGLAKHNGPVRDPGWALAEADADHSLDLGRHASLEAQVAALADDIAYNAHDIDDGLRAGLLELERLTGEVPLLAALWRNVASAWPVERRRARLVPILVRDLIGLMVDDLLDETRGRLARLAPTDAEAIRAAGQPTAAFSPPLVEQVAALRSHLHAHFYRHPSVARLREPAETVVRELFRHLVGNPGALPDRWRETCPSESEALARHVCDYVAGMTDRFALKEYERLVGPSPVPREILV